MQLLTSLALDGRRVAFQRFDVLAELFVLFLQLIDVSCESLVFVALVSVRQGTIRTQSYMEEEPNGERRGQNRSYLSAQAERPVNNRLIVLSGLKNKLAGTTNVLSRLGKTNGAIGPVEAFFLRSVFLQSVFPQSLPV